MNRPPTFFVVDTEGKDSLTEIAVIDAQGAVVYEAFVAEANDNPTQVTKIKPLKTILASR